MTSREIIIIHYDVIWKMIKHEHGGTYTLLHVYFLHVYSISAIYSMFHIQVLKL